MNHPRAAADPIGTRRQNLMQIPDDSVTPRSPRPWFQFSLRSLLVAALAVALIAAWYAPPAPPQLVAPSAWDAKTGKNIRWSAPLGGENYSQPVIHGGRVFVGTNNQHGYLKRLPKTVDLGVLLCLSERDGSLLWQASSAKLAAGRDQDWPMSGVMGSAAVQGERLWYVNNRCELVCLDVRGFRDQENDGPFRGETHRGPEEADVVWKLDMIAKLGVVPAYVSNTTPVVHGDNVYVCTCNGALPQHKSVPAPKAPSFLCVDKRTGRVKWSDNSPGANVLPHCVFNSPNVATINGQTQVLFPGRDGWLYAFAPEADVNARPRLLWKFDCNRKAARWIAGGRGKRNMIFGRPEVADGLVYVALGRSPEFADGDASLLCIDPTRLGDVSEELVFDANGRPAPPRRLRGFDPDAGESARPNPNSALVWRFEKQDLDGVQGVEFKERMHRSISGVAIAGGLVLANSFDGVAYCLDAKTGECHWTHDLLACCWDAPFIEGETVYFCDEDGDVAIFRLSPDPAVAMKNGEPWQTIQMPISVHARPASSPFGLYLAIKGRLYAIHESPSQTAEDSP